MILISYNLLITLLQVSGDGTDLANTLLPQGNGPLAPPGVVPVVGSIHSPTINVHQLNHQQILSLIQYYNFDFAIEPGEILPQRIQKVMYWLCEK